MIIIAKAERSEVGTIYAATARKDGGKGKDRMAYIGVALFGSKELLFTGVFTLGC